VAECLREVAEQLAGVGVDLLGEQADVVGERSGSLEDRAGAVDLTGDRQRLGQPERAEHTLVAAPIRSAIAIARSRATQHITFE
jgi:hypothetical protein